MQRIVVVALRIVLCYWCVSAACVASQLAWAPSWCVSRLTNSCCCWALITPEWPVGSLFSSPLCMSLSLSSLYREEGAEVTTTLRQLKQNRYSNNIHKNYSSSVFSFCRSVERFFVVLFTKNFRAPRNIDRTAGSTPAGHDVMYNTAHFPIVKKSRRSTAVLYVEK